jgi:predicted DCC family thiol-disulfide oxidoreductase YuxK
MEPTIVFFDGVCGVCNTAVDVLLRWDRDGALRFAPLQGETAPQHLSPQQIADLDSFWLLRDGQLLHRSTAVIRVLMDLGGFGRLAALGLLIPRPLRDAAYDAFARNRYRWFGRKDACRIPSPEERARFLP